MTPSNQHSDEAIAAYPWDKEVAQSVVHRLRTAFDRGRASLPVSTITDLPAEHHREAKAHILARQFGLSPIQALAAVDALDAAVPSTITDREKERLIDSWQHADTEEQILRAGNDMADALALPTVPLVSTREAIAKFLDEYEHVNFEGREVVIIDPEETTNELFAAGVLVDRGESDAQALEAAAEKLPGEAFLGASDFARDTRQAMERVLHAEAARLRSGKAEA